ncbi:MAG TPA: bifunctional diguanylate cyclase/phosphodiesterase, partial [Dermatophilaceae bacterium]
SVLGAVLVRGYQDAGLSRALDQGRAQAAVIEQMAIAPALSASDLSAGITRTERDRLQDATDLAIFSGSVSRLHLRSLEGVVVFSDDGRVEGSVPMSDPAFRSAAAGRSDARIVEQVPQSFDAIRVLEPVIPTSTGEVAGVLEVYLPYEAIAAKVQTETRATIARLALALVGLYAVLALISWATTRRLRRYAADHLHQALHDPLTGLPNRELFRQSAEDALERGRRGELGAMVLVDLDHFKEVNDTLGHHAGDELLRVVGRRLIESLRTDDIVARLGGDEFGLILPRGGSREKTVELLTRVRSELGAEIVLDGVSLSVEASFGVCFYPDGVETVEGLLQHADAAMYRGKRGMEGVVVYEPGTSLHTTHTLVMQSELRRALERDELVLYYQPKIELATGRVGGVEALVRWQHPERGLMAPLDFLPVAERSELIEPLTDWVLERALTDYTAWTAAGLDWTVAVNISARNLGSLAFADRVRRLLQKAGVRPHRVHIEVTETALAFDNRLAGEVVGALVKQGILMSIDDFGIGYTSLSQLRTLEVSEIKIDQTFVSGLLRNEQDRAIVRSVIDLGHNLGCTVTAEGVEWQDVADWLAEAGCDHAQGYLWMRPCPWVEVARAFGAAPDASFHHATVTESAPAWAGRRNERES